MTRDTINRAIQRGVGGEDNDDLKSNLRRLWCEWCCCSC